MILAARREIKREIFRVALVKADVFSFFSHLLPQKNEDLQTVRS